MRKKYLAILLFLVSFSLSHSFMIEVVEYPGNLGKKSVMNSRQREGSVKSVIGSQEGLVSSEDLSVFDSRLVLPKDVNSGETKTGSVYFSGKLTLGDLYILDKLFSSSQSKILDPNETTLGDLIIIDHVFSANPQLLDDQKLNLNNLVVLDKLFSKDDSNVLSSDATLGDLLILNEVFRENTNLLNNSK